MATNDKPLVAVVVGPESCGKTTLAQALGETLQAPVVPEVARDYLSERARRSSTGVKPYDTKDLLRIAQQQHAAEAAIIAGTSSPIVVADTDLTVIDIWWRERFGQPTAEFAALRDGVSLERRMYLVCYPDLRWVADPLRENPTDRPRLFRRYLALLDEMAAEYRVVWGEGSQRHRRALAYCKAQLR